MKKTNIYIYIVITLLSFSCTNKKADLDEINKISKINIPINSTILEYYDDYEVQLVFKILLKKKDVNYFLKKYNFRQADTLKTNEFHKTSTDKYLINDIENSFSPKEKIFGKDLQILKNKNTVLIVNRETSELWGLISYD